MNKSDTDKKEKADDAAEKLDFNLTPSPLSGNGEEKRYDVNKPTSHRPTRDSERGKTNRVGVDRRNSPINYRRAHDDIYKTKICEYYPKCPNGDKCNFAHGVGELRKRVSGYKSAMCFDLPNCRAGSRCNFAHSREELRSSHSTRGRNDYHYDRKRSYGDSKSFNTRRKRYRSRSSSYSSLNRDGERSYSPYNRRDYHSNSASRSPSRYRSATPDSKYMSNKKVKKSTENHDKKSKKSEKISKIDKNDKIDKIDKIDKNIDKNDQKTVKNGKIENLINFEKSEIFDKNSQNTPKIDKNSQNLPKNTQNSENSENLENSQLNLYDGLEKNAVLKNSISKNPPLKNVEKMPFSTVGHPAKISAKKPIKIVMNSRIEAEKTQNVQNATIEKLEEEKRILQRKLCEKEDELTIMSRQLTSLREDSRLHVQRLKRLHEQFNSDVLSQLSFFDKFTSE